MPVLVVGADTPLGELVMRELAGRAGEIRAFVTDPNVAAHWKARSVKVAVGDVSDPSHIGGAGLNCYSMVFLPHAAVDGRERSFAKDTEHVLAGWVESIKESNAQRAIWVELPATEMYRPLLSGLTCEVAVVQSDDRTLAELAKLIVELDDAGQVPAEYRFAG